MMEDPTQPNPTSLNNALELKGGLGKGPGYSSDSLAQSALAGQER